MKFAASGVFIFALVALFFVSTIISEAAVCTAINRPLFKGLSDALTGGQVTELQNFLKSQGYFSEAVTGFYGESTEAAVKKFQRRYTIALFGEVYNTGFGATGPLTRAKIKSVSCYVPPPKRLAETPATAPPAETTPIAPPATGTLSVTCRPSPGTIQVGSSATWRATIVTSPAGVTSHTYNWQGTDNLTGNSYTTQKNYSTTGSKSAIVTVDGQTFTCAQSLNVTVEPPEEEEEISWPIAGLTPEPLYGSTDSPSDQNYTYVTPRYRILLSSDLNTNVQYALNKMGNMPEGRRFYTSIASDAQHRIVGTHPDDDCQSVVDGVTTLTDFRCPWWEVGSEEAEESFTAFANAFESQGGEMDFIFFDTEQHVTNWLIQANGFDSPHARAIENDPRFSTLRPELEALSFQFEPSGDTTLQNSVTDKKWGPHAIPQPGAADNYLKWNELNNEMTADYIESAMFDPIQSKFSSVKGAEHSYSYHDQSYEVPDLNGHRIYSYGDGAIVGTHQSRALYGSLGNITQLGYLSLNAFDAFKYDQNQMRAMRLSSSASIAPEFATRFWAGDGAYNVQIENTDYYEENILHAAMVSEDDDHFLLWSNLTTSGDQTFDNILTEFNTVAGFNRQTLVNDLTDWDDDFVYTGTRIGGYKVWRFTPKLNGNENVAQFTTTPIGIDGKQSVVFNVRGDTVTFPDAFIYTPSNPVSDFGAWVIQTGSAGNPRVSSLDSGGRENQLASVYTLTRQNFIAAFFESLGMIAKGSFADFWSAVWKEILEIFN